MLTFSIYYLLGLFSMIFFATKKDDLDVGLLIAMIFVAPMWPVIFLLLGLELGHKVVLIKKREQ